VILLDKKKITIAVLLIILIVSDVLMLFAKDFLGSFLNVAAMVSILSGLSLIIIIVINSKKRIINPDEVDENYDLLSENKEENKICNICDTKNKITATYCTNCGSDLQDIVCPICDTVNPFDQKYCTECDTILQNKKRH